MIRTEKSSTAKLIADAEYHLGKLHLTPETAEMIPATERVVEELQRTQTEYDVKKRGLVAARDAYDETGLELRKILRRIQIETLMSVDKDRSIPSYAALWPQGAGWICRYSGRKTRQRARAVAEMLEDSFPEIHARFGEVLDQAIGAAEQAEDAYRSAQIARRVAFGEVVKKRAALTDRMRGNRSLLRLAYPRNQRKVRSFFRGYRASESEEGDAPEPTQQPVEGGEHESPITDPAEVPSSGAEPEPANQAA